MSVYIAHLAVVSPHLISEQVDTMHTFLNKYLPVADARKIAAYELQHAYKWDTVLPYVKMAYVPKSQQCDHALLPIVQDMSLHAIVIALQGLMIREPHRKLLKREGLVDFFTCMPWYLTGPAKEAAKELVSMVQRAPDMDIQPPSLVNLAKGCVARHYCGLPTVVQLSVSEILQHVS